MQQQQVTTDNIKTGEKKSGGKKKKIVTVLIVVVVLAGLGGGAYYLLSSPQGSSESSLPGNGLNRPETNVVDENPLPTPTQVPVEIDKSELMIELLNGTGIPGEASLVKTELEELGYVNVEVGNADAQDQEETIVTFSSELPQSFIDDFISELESIYTEVRSSTSGSLEKFDIRIIAGLRSSYTPAPTKAPEPTATPTEDTESITPTPTVTPTPTL